MPKKKPVSRSGLKNGEPPSTASLPPSPAVNRDTSPQSNTSTPSLEYWLQKIEEDSMSCVARIEVALCYLKDKKTPIDIPKACQHLIKAFTFPQRVTNYLRLKHPQLMQEIFTKIHGFYLKNPQDIWANLFQTYRYFYFEANEGKLSFQHCQTAASLDPNNSVALRMLGIHYARGVGTNQNLEKALEYFQQATDKAPNDGCNWLSLVKYYQDQDTAESRQKSFECLKTVVEKVPSYMPAWNVLGFYYHQGIGTAVNPSEALKCLKHAYEKHHLWEKHYLILANYYVTGIDTQPADLQQAFNIYQTGIKQYPNNFSLLDALKNCYEKGIGISKDPALAKEYAARSQALRNSNFNLTANPANGSKSSPSSPSQTAPRMVITPPCTIELLTPKPATHTGNPTTNNLVNNTLTKTPPILRFSGQSPSSSVGTMVPQTAMVTSQPRKFVSTGAFPTTSLASPTTATVATAGQISSTREVQLLKQEIMLLKEQLNNKESLLTLKEQQLTLYQQEMNELKKALDKASTELEIEKTQRSNLSSRAKNSSTKRARAS